MVVVIAGSRHIQDHHQVDAALAASGFIVSEVVSGTCRGVDQLAKPGPTPAASQSDASRPIGGATAAELGGRNLVMIEYAAARGGGLVAIWDGASPGTAHSIRYARQQGLAVYVHPCPAQSL